MREARNALQGQRSGDGRAVKGVDIKGDKEKDGVKDDDSMTRLLY